MACSQFVKLLDGCQTNVDFDGAELAVANGRVPAVAAMLSLPLPGDRHALAELAQEIALIRQPATHGAVATSCDQPFAVVDEGHLCEVTLGARDDVQQLARLIPYSGSSIESGTGEAAFG